MYNSLKEATAENHKKAEQTELVKLIFKKEISALQYSQLLANQLVYYSAIENNQNFKFDSNLPRASRIVKDLFELHPSTLLITPESYQYADYLETLDDRKLWAHIYVHYLGDMAGGQMLKRCVPGAGTRFDFTDTADLISQIRMKVSIADANEANCAFEWTIRIYNELYRRIREIS
jgi:heme oxygenase